MQNIELNEGQEFFIGGQRYVVKDGAPVQEAKPGPLGGELVEIGKLKWVKGERVYIVGIVCDEQPKNNNIHVAVDASNAAGFNFIDCPSNLMVEINVPQPQQSGRVMTAGEAVRLPDIVGKRVFIECEVNSTEGTFRPLVVRPKSNKSSIEWRVSEDIFVEVLD